MRWRHPGPSRDAVTGPQIRLGRPHPGGDPDAGGSGPTYRAKPATQGRGNRPRCWPCWRSSRSSACAAAGRALMPHRLRQQPQGHPHRAPHHLDLPDRGWQQSTQHARRPTAASHRLAWSWGVGGRGWPRPFRGALLDGLIPGRELTTTSGGDRCCQPSSHNARLSAVTAASAQLSGGLSVLD